MAIEIDVTSPGVSKLPIYARFGVPEVWVWSDGEIICRRLTETGDYEVAEESGVLPGFPLAFVVALLRDRPAAANEDLQDELIEHLRAGD